MRLFQSNPHALRSSHVAKRIWIPAISTWVVILNILAISLWTVGVFVSLYAGCLNPSLRVTSSTLSSVVNGVATIMIFVFIDPHLSTMTDDVVEGKISEARFRQAIVWLTAGRLAETILAQLFLVPAATLVVLVATVL